MNLGSVRISDDFSTREENILGPNSSYSLSSSLRLRMLVVYNFLQLKSVLRLNKSDLIGKDFHALHLPVSVRRLSMCITKLGRMNLKRTHLYISHS